MLSVDEVNNLKSENQYLREKLEQVIKQYNKVVEQNKQLQEQMRGKDENNKY